jgi:hypothetical protein
MYKRDPRKGSKVSIESIKITEATATRLEVIDWLAMPQCLSVIV